MIKKFVAWVFGGLMGLMICGTVIISAYRVPLYSDIAQFTGVLIAGLFSGLFWYQSGRTELIVTVERSKHLNAAAGVLTTLVVLLGGAQGVAQLKTVTLLQAGIPYPGTVNVLYYRFLGATMLGILMLSSVTLYKGFRASLELSGDGESIKLPFGTKKMFIPWWGSLIIALVVLGFLFWSTYWIIA